MTTVFVCIDWFHPAYKAGGPVQSIVNLVAQYPNGQVNFKIWCSNTDLDGAINQGVPFNQWCYYNDYTQVWYVSKDQQSVQSIKREIKYANTDVLFIIGIYSWYFDLVPLLLAKAPVKILSVRGMLHPGALSQKSFKKKIYLALLKMAGIQHRYYFHATDATEASFIQRIFGGHSRIFIAGNFPRTFGLQPSSQKQMGALKMVSIALISPMKNIELVLDALQRCRQQVQYDIYGPVKDARYWEQCLAKIKMLPANIIVNYKGDLSPTLTEVTLKEYELFILPSKSENFGHAIFEALSAGKPVITSSYTPFNDLHDQQAGQNVAIEDNAELTKAIDFFAAMSADAFAYWNTGAHHYATRKINHDQLKEQYDRLFFFECLK